MTDVRHIKKRKHKNRKYISNNLILQQNDTFNNNCPVRTVLTKGRLTLPTCNQPSGRDVTKPEKKRKKAQFSKFLENSTNKLYIGSTQLITNTVHPLFFSFKLRVPNLSFSSGSIASKQKYKVPRSSRAP